MNEASGYKTFAENEIDGKRRSNNNNEKKQLLQRDWKGAANRT